MVSKASDDFPEPDSPVITTRAFRGSSTSMFLRLCSRAPRTMRASPGIDSEASGVTVGRSTLWNKGAYCRLGVDFPSSCPMMNSKDKNPKRDRRWQTSQERARVAAELIEEAESLTETGAIATPHDVARDELPPPIRVAHSVATPGPRDITDQLDDRDPEEPALPPSQQPASPPSTSTNLPEAAPPAGDDPLYVSAKEASERGETDKAAASYRELLAKNPGHVKARNNLALILDARGDRDGALAELDRALEAEPDNTALLLNRAAILGATVRYAAAQRDLQRVLRADPDNVEALFNLGIVLTRRGMWREGTDQLRRAVQVEPGRAAAWYYLGEALNHMDDLTGAHAAYERAVELQPVNPRALYGIGKVLDRLNRPDEATVMYRRSREMSGR